MESILSVSELTEKVRNALESRLPFVWVRGEVTNFSRAASGHIYFSLKDAFAQLNCVWFSRSQKRCCDERNFDPLTGEVYDKPRPDMRKILANGMELICAGGMEVYAQRGQYQLLVELVEPSGEGLLAQAFEQRKQELAAKGYFDPDRKRPLPANPSRVALITSPHGAAIHDFLTLSQKRGLSSVIRLFPVPVQGENAAEKISLAIEQANSDGWAEVIVMIRGGGSLEDLWAFNEEALAKAVHDSRLPILAGIGHEVDYTIADLTADARAATPSHAAQLLWPLRRELWQRLDESSIRLARSVNYILADKQKRLDQKIQALRWLSPLQRLAQRKKSLEDLARLLHKGFLHWLNEKCAGFRSLESKFANASMLAPRLRLDEERLRWLGRSLKPLLEKLIARYERNVEKLENALDRRIEDNLARNMAKWRGLDAFLQSHDPLAPLKRGYAFLYDARGILTSVKDCAPGQRINGRLADGVLELEVIGKKEMENAAHEDD